MVLQCIWFSIIPDWWCYLIWYHPWLVVLFDTLSSLTGDLFDIVSSLTELTWHSIIPDWWSYLAQYHPWLMVLLGTVSSLTDGVTWHMHVWLIVTSHSNIPKILVIWKIKSYIKSIINISIFNTFKLNITSYSNQYHPHTVPWDSNITIASFYVAPSRLPTLENNGNSTYFQGQGGSEIFSCTCRLVEFVFSLHFIPISPLY